MTVKVLGFDFFGTLVEARAEADLCVEGICRKLHQYEIAFSPEEFTQTYREVASGHRRVRFSTHREISNLVLLKETLQRLGYELEDTSQPIVEAVEAYFSPWILTVYEDALNAIKSLRSTHRIGLISNFTYTPFLLSSLSSLGLEKYFELVLVSEQVGWRKPHPLIFNRFLRLMGVEAGEALFVGDELNRDVLGAKNAGMKAAWIVRGPSKKPLEESSVKPDFIIRSLEELEEILMQPR